MYRQFYNKFTTNANKFMNHLSKEKYMPPQYFQRYGVTIMLSYAVYTELDSLTKLYVNKTVKNPCTGLTVYGSKSELERKSNLMFITLLAGSIAYQMPFLVTALWCGRTYVNYTNELRDNIKFIKNE